MLNCRGLCLNRTEFISGGFTAGGGTLECDSAQRLGIVGCRAYFIGHYFRKLFLKDRPIGGFAVVHPFCCADCIPVVAFYITNRILPSCVFKKLSCRHLMARPGLLKTGMFGVGGIT